MYTITNRGVFEMEEMKNINQVSIESEKPDLIESSKESEVRFSKCFDIIE